MSDRRGIDITHTPELGPEVLSMLHNDRESEIGVKESLELLRWMREDLRRVTNELKKAYDAKITQDRVSGITLLNEQVQELVRLSKIPWWKKIFGGIY